MDESDDEMIQLLETAIEKLKKMDCRIFSEITIRISKTGGMRSKQNLYPSKSRLKTGTSQKSANVY